MSTKRLKRVTPYVERLLAEKPMLRSNDIALCIAFWHLEGLHLTEEQRNKLLECTPPESIRRVRQKLQESGKYLPAKPVSEQRSLLQQEHRQVHRSTPARQWGSGSQFTLEENDGHTHEYDWIPMGGRKFHRCKHCGKFNPSR